MKKFFASLCLAAASVFGMQATSVYILGNVGDQGWDPSVGTEMTSTDGVNFTYTGDFNASSYFSFTTMLAETSSGWGDIEPYRIAAPANNYELNSANFGQTIYCNEMGIDVNNAFLITAAGNYTLTLNVEDYTLVCSPNGEVQEEVITPDGLYIMGQVNGQGWNTNQGTKMTAEGNVYTGEIAIADSVGNFSFTRALSQTASNWSGIAQYRFGAIYDNYQLAEELGTAVALGEDGTDFSFALPQGNYKLVVDLDARTLVATALDAPTQKYYIIGNVNGWDAANPIELVQDGDVYTCKATVEGESYFVFTGAKGTWDAINAFRFGPMDGNEEVTVGAEVATQISSNTDAAYYFTGEGVEYTFTFNPTALTFKVEAAQAGNPCDMNGDGVVDVTDVNIVINVILNKATNPKADVDGNGVVDFTDLNIVVNTMLGK